MKKRSKRYLERHLHSMEDSLRALKRRNSEGRYYNNPYKTGYFKNQIRTTKMRLNRL